MQVLQSFSGCLGSGTIRNMLIFVSIAQFGALNWAPTCVNSSISYIRPSELCPHTCLTDEKRELQ